jgi:hypothetical protein
MSMTSLLKLIVLPKHTRAIPKQKEKEWHLDWYIFYTCFVECSLIAWCLKTNNWNLKGKQSCAPTELLQQWQGNEVRAHLKGKDDKDDSDPDDQNQQEAGKSSNTSSVSEPMSTTCHRYPGPRHRRTHTYLHSRCTMNQIQSAKLHGPHTTTLTVMKTKQSLAFVRSQRDGEVSWTGRTCDLYLDLLPVASAVASPSLAAGADVSLPAMPFPCSIWGEWIREGGNEWGEVRRRNGAGGAGV